jgi:hypothetical protein
MILIVLLIFRLGRIRIMSKSKSKTLARCSPRRMESDPL